MRSMPVLMVKPLSSPVLLLGSPTKPLKLTFTPGEERVRGENVDDLELFAPNKMKRFSIGQKKAIALRLNHDIVDFLACGGSSALLVRAFFCDPDRDLRNLLIVLSHEDRGVSENGIVLSEVVHAAVAQDIRLSPRS